MTLKNQLSLACHHAEKAEKINQKERKKRPYILYR
jgi:hypothetical protein